MRNAVRISLVLMAGATLAACGTTTPRYTAKPSSSAPDPNRKSYTNADGQRVGKPYQVGGVWYVPREQPGYDETGVASWYGPGFHQKTTATGEIFDMEAVSAAHTTLPLPSMVEVTNLDNGRKLVVRVNDRGPFVDNRIIDLSKEAARQLGYERAGIARVRVRYLGPPSLLGREAGVRFASNKVSPPNMALPGIALPGAAPPIVAPPIVTPPVAEPAVIFTGSTVKAAGSIVVASLPPPAMVSSPVPAAEPPPAAEPQLVQASMTQAAVPASLRIQAGAFASEANAQRAVSQLSLAGQATIELMTRSDGMTLYRVTLPAPADEAEAFALRDRVAEIGFADARVVRPF